jgi:hypothetical protein
MPFEQSGSRVRDDEASSQSGDNGGGRTAGPPDRTKPVEPAYLDGSNLEALEASLVWIFGSPRTGSSWLMRMLQANSRLIALDETYLPVHLVPVGAITRSGEYFHSNHRADAPSYFFAKRYLPELGPELRELVLRQLSRQVREVVTKRTAKARRVVIKEPNGTHAADTVFWLLPRGRMIFLLRDGRDVIDSMADALLNQSSWWTDRRKDMAAAHKLRAKNRLSFIMQQSTQWVYRIEAGQRAFDALPDERRMLIRYEDLLADTPGQLRAIFDWLEVSLSESRLERIVANYAFTAIEPERRGPGTPYRAAQPGLWRENFSEQEQTVLEDIMGKKLRELGYAP